MNALAKLLPQDETYILGPINESWIVSCKEYGLVFCRNVKEKLGQLLQLLLRK